MPTVLRFGGLRAAIYPNDHRPAHVHVMGNGHEAVFNLKGIDGTVAVRENYGFSQRELWSIERTLVQNFAPLIAAWEVIHGTEN